MFEDLRGFLTHLESQKQLLRVKDEVERQVRDRRRHAQDFGHRRAGAVV